jgi:hypothetical protein
LQILTYLQVLSPRDCSNAGAQVFEERLVSNIHHGQSPAEEERAKELRKLNETLEKLRAKNAYGETYDHAQAQQDNSK